MPKKTAKKTKARANPAAKSTRAKATKQVKAIPDGYVRLNPMLVMNRCADALVFYTKVLGGKERMRFPLPDGKIAHAEIDFGDKSGIFVADATMEHAAAPARLCLYVKDVDSVHRTAIQAGATSKQEPQDQFYGDRSSRFVDPFGNEWTLMTHIEDVSEKELMKRMASMGPPPGAA